MIDVGSVRQNLSHKVVKNTLYNVLGRFWGILGSVFLTPYIVSRIGVERFGLWAIVGVITGYFGLFDLGIGVSFTRYIAEFYTKKEYNKISLLVNTGFTLYFVFALVGVLLVFLLKSPLLALLNIPHYLRYEAGVVLLMGIALFGASNVISPFTAMQYGLQRMDISNNLAIGLSIVNIIGAVFFLERGFGIIGLMINNVISFGIMSIASVTIAYRLMPELRFRIFRFDRAIFKRLFNFGYNMQIARVAVMIAGQTDKILITFFLSIGIVAYFQLASSIVYGAASIGIVLTSALTPAFAEIEARGERPRLIEAYIRSAKYVSFFIAPIFIYLAISAQQVMFMWMGHGYERSIPIIQILAVAFLMNTLSLVPGSVCMAIDKTQLMAVGGIVSIITNIVFSTIFIKIFGFSGAAWGMLIAVNAGTIFFVRRLHIEIKVPISNIVKVIAPYFAGCAIAAAILFIASAVIDGSHFVIRAGRLDTMILFCVKGVIFAAGYLAAICYMKPFNADEMGIIEKKIPFIGPVIIKLIARHRRGNLS